MNNYIDTIYTFCCRMLIAGLVIGIILLAIFSFTGCAIELRADGTKKVSFTPSAADYKAIRNYSR